MELKGFSMHSIRRSLLRLGCTATVLAAGAWSGRAGAHHGWSSFQQDDPVYLEGVARIVKWRNPHAEISLEPALPLRLPQDLSSRQVPAQSASVNMPALLARARLPSGKAAMWEIELAPLFRMAQWRVPEVRAGQTLAVLGFMLRESLQFRDDAGAPVSSAAQGPQSPGSLPDPQVASTSQGPPTTTPAPLLRAELLFLDGRVYPLRSGPA